MKHWQQHSFIEQMQLVDITSAKTKLSRLAIEKDWWVVMTLKALSLTNYANLMTFKGGTLSFHKPYKKLYPKTMVVPFCTAILISKT